MYTWHVVVSLHNLSIIHPSRISEDFNADTYAHKVTHIGKPSDVLSVQGLLYTAHMV